jgi:two-component system OmpR family sensor kinase/two-component system sensor histidine kinase BaeS
MGTMMGQRLQLADARGNLILDSGDVNAAGSVNQADLERAISLMSDGEVVGYLLHEGGMVFTSGDERELLGRLTRPAYIAAGVATGFALLLALLLSSSLLKPVHALTEAAAELSQGDLSRRVSVRGDDELAVLGKTFNEMASTLENAEQSRRAMTADIAHELRTPLAVQRAQLEAIQDGVYPANDENLGVLLEQNILLSRLVADLRTLALADSGQLQLDFTLTDLNRLTARVADQFRPQAAARGIEIEFTRQETCPEISVDPGRVEQIIGNLISNALRYTPQQSSVKINMTCSNEQVAITVRDAGPGIPQGAEEKIFTRFYRADQSRSRAEGGTGLGLAIARQLALAQGGEVTARNHPGGGAEFQLSFPRVSGKQA